MYKYIHCIKKLDLFVKVPHACQLIHKHHGMDILPSQLLTSSVTVYSMFFRIKNKERNPASLVKFAKSATADRRCD